MHRDGLTDGVDDMLRRGRARDDDGCWNEGDDVSCLLLLNELAGVVGYQGTMQSIQLFKNGVSRLEYYYFKTVLLYGM